MNTNKSKTKVVAACLKCNHILTPHNIRMFSQCGCPACGSRARVISTQETKIGYKNEEALTKRAA